MQKLESKVAKRIRNGLFEDPTTFLYNNRGILLSVAQAHFDNRGKGEGGMLTLTFADPDTHGLVDGGHTYKVTLQALRGHIERTPEGRVERRLESDQFVRLEILEGAEGFFDDLAEARNTSNQVEDKALDELRDRFEWIHEELKDTDYGHLVAYKQFDDKPIDIRDIISYLCVFNVECFEESNHPLISYTSKKKCLDIFRVESERGAKDSFKKLRPLLRDILRLRDHIYRRMPELYNATKEGGGRFGRVRGVQGWQGGEARENLYFLPKEGGEFVGSPFTIPSSFIYPCLAAFRSIVKVGGDGRFCWAADPFSFFDGGVGAELALRTVERAVKTSNPNEVGKDKGFWEQLYIFCKLRALEKGVIKL
jgi:hypothetical protein